MGGQQHPDAAEQIRAAAAARMIRAELAPHWSQEVETELEEQDAPGRKTTSQNKTKNLKFTREVSVFGNKIRNTNVNDQLVVVESELVVVALQPQSVPFDGSARKNRII